MSNSKCPLCDSDIAISDFYDEDSGEYFIFCERCGYEYRRELVDKNKFISSEIKPLAVSKILLKQRGDFNSLTTKKELYEFREHIRNIRGCVKIAELRYKKDDEWIIENVLTGEIRLSDDVLKIH
jgi:hypothetical protein|tara:strand:- start:49 stop:423 length:375 start_codon:yes stop_codon:yes gene_type:complete